MREWPNPMIIGHRGTAGEAPENTMASFLMAVEQGAHAVELDVCLSKDGELMVIHDDTLDRTTNGEGIVAELTAKEIRQYDAGLWFHERFEGEKVPLLEEVFDRLPSDFLINVELKGGQDRLEERLAELLVRRNRVETVFLSSFHHKKLANMKRLIPEIRVGLGYAANVVDHIAFADLFGPGLFSLHPKHGLIGLNEIGQAVERGTHVYPWTVNEPEMMRMLLHANVSGLITDFPGRAHASLQQL